MMHYDERKQQPHSAERDEIASMLKAGGKLIPSDIRRTTGMCLNKEARLSWRRVSGMI